MGRQRSIVWGPRTLDVDVLIFGARNIRTPELHVPHPRLPERRFALAPLAEIAGGLPHPESGISISELLASCPDTLAVRRLGPLAALLPEAAAVR
jgi:2-amino-4-hydroxy-6-hydroxymethyldihydropteridine diphosphokinase